MCPSGLKYLDISELINFALMDGGIVPIFIA
jgi:hypothetical protein